MGKVKECDILLFPPSNWIGRIIAWSTDSAFCHVAVCVSKQLGLMVEAQAGLVRSIKLSDLPANYALFRVRKEYPYEAYGVISYLLKSLNARYDYTGVLYLGLLKVLAKVGFNTRGMANRLQKDKDYFCSELCYLAFLEGGGLDIVPEVPSGDIVSPGDIARSSVLKTLLLKYSDAGMV